jgi:hypothetical protein
VTMFTTGRTRVGAAVANDMVRVVAARRGRILWAVEASSTGKSAGEALCELLVAKGAVGWFSAGITVAVGPTCSQVKHVTRLPALTNTLELAKVVQGGTTRFFVHRGVPLVATGVQLAEEGVVLAGVIDEPAMTDIIEAVARHRVRVNAIMPTLAVLPAVFEDGRVTWRDGDVTAEVLVANRRLASVRCVPSTCAGAANVAATTEIADSALPVAFLSALGDRSHRFADAYAATMAASITPLTVNVRAQRRRTRAIASWRITAASIAATISLAAAVITPGIRARSRPDTGRAGISRRLKPSFERGRHNCAVLPSRKRHCAKHRMPSMNWSPLRLRGAPTCSFSAL